MFRPYQHLIHIPGTLTANVVVRWTAPFDCTIQHASLVASNDSDGRVKLGTSADDDEFLTYTDLGDSGVPVEVLAPDGFRYQVTPHIKKGDIVIVTIDFDGAVGTAAADVTVLLTFEEG